MVDFQKVENDHVLAVGDVGISVIGELGVEPVAGFARFSVADSIGKNDEVFSCIERLPFAKEFVGEDRNEELVPRPARAVHDENRIINLSSFWVLLRLADRGAVKFEVFELASVGKCEFGHGEVMLDWGRVGECKGGHEGQ